MGLCQVTDSTSTGEMIWAFKASASPLITTQVQVSKYKLVFMAGLILERVERQLDTRLNIWLANQRLYFNWTLISRLTISIDKCYVLNIGAENVCCNLEIFKQTLPCVLSASDLGICHYGDQFKLMLLTPKVSKTCLNIM